MSRVMGFTMIVAVVDVVLVTVIGTLGAFLYNLAAALLGRPRLLVLDEPVSALDPSVRAGVLNLLADLQDDLGLGYLFICHDRAVVRHFADRVGEMRDGRVSPSPPR